MKTLLSVSSRFVTSVTTAAVLLCAAAAPTYAGPGPAPAVTGFAWNVDNTPIPSAHVQLRNLATAKIVGQSVGDEAGRFTFINVEGGTYVVELVGRGDKVLTVGRAFVIAPGETVTTFVRLGTRLPWFSGFFGNAAAAAAATAASFGITALAPVQLPRSSTR